MIGNIVSAASSEFKRIYNNKRMLLIMIFLPTIFVLLTGYIYSKKTVMGIDFAVLDLDNTSLSRAIVTGFMDCERFDIKYFPDSEKEMDELIETEKAYGCLVIPHNFMKDLKEGKPTEVLVTVNGTNLTISNTVVSYANEIIQTINAGTSVKLLHAKGFIGNSALNSTMPISFRSRVWYNPTFNYLSFMLIGFVGVIIQQVTLMNTSIAIVQNRENGNIKFGSALKQSIEKIIGVAIPNFIINFTNCLIGIIEAIYIFKLQMRGSFLPLILLSAVFVMGVTFLGVFLSALFKSDLEATQIAMFIAVPSFLLSGFVWPLFMLPNILRVVAEILPLTHYIQPLRKVVVMGVGLDAVRGELGILALYTVVFLPLTIIVYSFKLSALKHKVLEGFTKKQTERSV